MLAVLAVSDKRDIETLATGLLNLGWDVVATEGTHRRLAGNGVHVGKVSDIAGVPTLLGGRVKTLTLPVMGGILARDTGPDLEEIRTHGIRRVELVCCNYYLLPPPAGDGSPAFEEFRERIDVGGPAMLRAAAKNCAHVIPLSDPDDYPGVLRSLADAGGAPEGVDPARRVALAKKAFDISADYDARIAGLLDGLGAGQRHG